MPTAKQHAYEDVVKAVVELGFPAEFGVVIADELGGEKSLVRMAAYLRGARPTTPDEIADELLAILDDRRRWAEQRQAEAANATLTKFYNRPGREQP